MPEHKTAKYLNAEEKDYAATRLGKVEKTHWDWDVVRRVLFSWQFYLLPLVFMRE